MYTLSVEVFYVFSFTATQRLMLHADIAAFVTAGTKPALRKVDYNRIAGFTAPRHVAAR
jgi:hypothetical protein